MKLERVNIILRQISLLYITSWGKIISAATKSANY